MFLILTCKWDGDGSIRSCEGVYVRVYLIYIRSFLGLESSQKKLTVPLLQPVQSRPDERAAFYRGGAPYLVIRSSLLRSRVQGFQEILNIVAGFATAYMYEVR